MVKARRTRFVADMGEINYEDLIADDMSVITMTQMNYVKRLVLILTEFRIEAVRV